MDDPVGLALLVVLERLAPTGRIAFVVPDMFAVPFDEIASIAGRTPAGCSASFISPRSVNPRVGPAATEGSGLTPRRAPSTSAPERWCGITSLAAMTMAPAS